MSGDMSSRLTECEKCKAKVIPARTDKGRELDINPEPAPGGKFALHDRAGKRMLATTPPPHLAFGRKLHTEHKCASPRTRGGRAVS